MTVLVWVSCAIPIAIGFAISVITLFSKLKLNKKTWGNPEAWIIGEQTVSLSLIAFCTACLLALLIGFEVKLQWGTRAKWVLRCGSFSYALPGTILSFGVLWPLSSIDNVIDHWMRGWFGISSGLLFTGTAFALVSGYVIHLFHSSLWFCR